MPYCPQRANRSQRLSKTRGKEEGGTEVWGRAIERAECHEEPIKSSIVIRDSVKARLWEKMPVRKRELHITTEHTSTFHPLNAGTDPALYKHKSAQPTAPEQQKGVIPKCLR